MIRHYYRGINKNILKGFSLPEIMVAVTLFSFVGLISSSIILNMNINNKLIISKKKVYDSIDLSMEDMSREVQEGGEYYTNSDASATNSLIRFVPKFSTSTCVEYTATSSLLSITIEQLNNNIIASNTKIIRTEYATSTSDPKGINLKELCRIETNNSYIKEQYDITSPDTNIIRFYATSSFGTSTTNSDGSPNNNPDTYLPIASVIIEGYSNYNPKARFRLEKSISRRYSE